jgi:hypothetical protein
MSNFLKAFILVILVSGCAKQDVTAPVDKIEVVQLSEIATKVRDAANEDQISNKDLGIWYSIYKGTYLYGKEFDFEGQKDFGVIFDKQMSVRDKLMPNKTVKFKEAVNSVFEKYKELEYNDTNQSKFLEEVSSIADGIKAGID